MVSLGCLGFNLMGKFWHLADTFSWRRREQGNHTGVSEVKLQEVQSSLLGPREGATSELALPSPPALPSALFTRAALARGLAECEGLLFTKCLLRVQLGLREAWGRGG